MTRGRRTQRQTQSRTKTQENILPHLPRPKETKKKKAPLTTTSPFPPKTGPYDNLLAGLVGGYFVFGRGSRRSGKISSVNQQIVIYVFARVVLALARLAVAPGRGLPLVSRERPAALLTQHAWPVFAAASWGMVMHLFRHHPDDLQPSLRSSMTYIYLNSDDWDGLRNFLWHNK